MKSKWMLVFSGLLLASSVQAQGIALDSRDGQEYPTLPLNGQEWFTRNVSYQGSEVSALCPVETDCHTLGLFYHWADTAKVCPEGWQLPSFAHLLDLIAGLEGKVNSRGGKRVHRQVLDPLNIEMAGIYLAENETPLRARGSMEVWLSRTDTVWNNPAPESQPYNGLKIIGLHLYHQGKDSTTIEPTYINATSDMLINCRCIKKQ